MGKTGGGRTAIMKTGTLVVLAALVLAAKSTGALQNTPSSTAPDPASIGGPLPGSRNGQGPKLGSYRDGSYYAVGSYSTPGGTQSIGVQLTLSGDEVTDSSVFALATGQPSKNYQQEFADRHKQHVVGKKINEVHLTKVSSSSVTPLGFNEAVERIKQDARL